MIDSGKPQKSFDPFFDLPNDSTWNACIGVQGDALNYVDGYLEAATELASAVLDKKLYEKRDTLVLPILYNARHAVELTQKFVIATLHNVGAIVHAAPRDHDVKAHWKILRDSAVGDEALRALFERLEPFVTSLSRIDDDGQSLRYAIRRDGGQSMPDKSLANISTIHKGLGLLSDILPKLRDRVIEFARERQTKTFTRECSRTDLFEIARLLPPRSNWNQAEFDTAKLSIRQRFQLSGRKFSAALDAIQGCRETKSIIGVETPLAHLEDSDVVMAVKEWSKLPRAPQPAIIGPQLFNRERWELMREQDRIVAEVTDTLAASLSLEKLADLQAVFYIGRDSIPAEHYESRVEAAIRGFRHRDLKRSINDLIVKVNFKISVSASLVRLGRLRLAASLDAI